MNSMKSESFKEYFTIINEGVYNLMQVLFICQICEELIFNPKSCSKCRDTYCYSCLEDYINKTSTCPEKCLQPSIDQAPKDKLISLDQLLVRCKCGIEEKLTEAHLHRDLCEFPRLNSECWNCNKKTSSSLVKYNDKKVITTRKVNEELELTLKHNEENKIFVGNKLNIFNSFNELHEEITDLEQEKLEVTKVINKKEMTKKMIKQLEDELKKGKSIEELKSRLTSIEKNISNKKKLIEESIKEVSRNNIKINDLKSIEKGVLFNNMTLTGHSDRISSIVQINDT